MKQMINSTHIEGLLYEHRLIQKTTGPNSKTPGQPYLSGDISIATSSDGSNIVNVHFTYCAEFTSTGKTNKTYTILMNILNGYLKTVMKDGREDATPLRIDSAIALNEFYTEAGEFVSTKRNEGGFVHVVEDALAEEKLRNTFTCDMLITAVSRVAADEEKQTPERVIVKGAIFDFRKALLPIEFSAVNPNAMNYFEGLDASNSSPVLTKVWGNQISSTVVKTISEESAFGDANVREVKSSRKDFVITGTSKETYLWNDESTMLASELVTAMANRQTALATMKKDTEDYRAAKKASGASNPVATMAAPSAGTFNF